MAMRGPTTDHDEIRSWAKSYNAVPAEVVPAIFDGDLRSCGSCLGKRAREDQS